MNVIWLIATMMSCLGASLDDPMNCDAEGVTIIRPYETVADCWFDASLLLQVDGFVGATCRYAGDQHD